MQPLKSKLTIIENYAIDVEITNNPYHFALTDLFKMATRINKKDNFYLSARFLASI